MKCNAESKATDNICQMFLHSLVAHILLREKKKTKLPASLLQRQAAGSELQGQYDRQEAKPAGRASAACQARLRAALTTLSWTSSL